MRRTAARVILVCLALAPMFVLGLLLGARTLALGSLARLDGRERVSGLGDKVTIERDALGVARIRAVTLIDACFAQGFAHAQDRFYQMDETRRLSSGRLSAVAGVRAVDVDRSFRTLGLRETAERALADLPERHRAMIAAYTDGVNAGLGALDARPPEYFVMFVRPEPWREVDCIFVALSMAHGLEMGFGRERTRALMHGALGRELGDFFTPELGVFDAPIDGTETPDLPPIPAPVDERAIEQVGGLVERPVVIGSNGFVVSGTRTRFGGAMLASDMHLRLSVPNTWYRVQMEWGADGGGERRLVGVSLPGVPGIAAGSNGDVAWGFTNTTGDHADYILIETDPDDPSRYRTPDGWERFGTRRETIEVRGAEAHEFEVRTTRWGPIVDEDPATGQPRALKWMLMDAERFNLDLFDLIEARDAREAADIAAGWYGPSQNAMIADRFGAIAWTVTGAVPRRVGFDGKLPVSWADGARAWDGVIDDESRPRIVDPREGYLVTANNRTLAVEQSRTLGTHWANGSRAKRIMELLDGRDGLSESDLLAIQLDTRSMVHAEYARHLRELVPAVRPRIPEDWDARADVGSVEFWIVDTWARRVRRALLASAVERCRELDASFSYSWFMDDDWVLRLLRERPESWVPEGYDSWASFASAHAPGVEVMAWGEWNRANIRHRFSGFAPGWASGIAGRWLDMPDEQLPGDAMTVRVQTARFGASERLVVSPGREEEAIFHMPTGQSGHFLSRFYRAGHGAWVRGEATGLLAGEALHTLTLEPR